MGFESVQQFQQESNEKEINLEKAKEDFVHLGALQWMGQLGERAMHGKEYHDVHNVLKQIDYETVLPMAETLRNQYREDYERTFIAESYAKNLQTVTLEGAQKHAEELGASKIKGNQIAFQGGYETDDHVRVYIAPKLHNDLLDSVNRVLDKLKDIKANIKINNADWYDEVAGRIGNEQTVRPTPFLNRLVVYLDRKSPDTSKFLQRLAEDKELLKRMEDSGEWSYTGRIPLALGISIAEGSAQKSWDMDEGKEYKATKQWLQSGVWPEEYALKPHDMWFKKQEVQEARRTKSLEPLGRVTKMPALRAD